MRLKTIAEIQILFISLSLVLVGGSALNQSRSAELTTSGNVKTIGVDVYADPALTQPLTHIDWGFADPNSTVVRTCYIVNNGNFPITLNMTTSDWSPANITNYMELSWDREGWILYEGQSIQAIFTLSISADVWASGARDFSFKITIIGYEYSE